MFVVGLVRRYKFKALCEATVVVKGSFIGIPSNGRRVTFRMLHLWDFKDHAISRASSSGWTAAQSPRN